MTFETAEYSDPLEEWWDGLGPKPFGCNERQVAFCRHFLQPDMTAKEAARRAGYSDRSEDSLANQGSTQKNNPKCKALLRAAKEQLEEFGGSEILTTDEMLKLWSYEARHGSTTDLRIKASKFVADYWKEQMSRNGPEAELHQFLAVCMEFKIAGYFMACDLGHRDEYLSYGGSVPSEETVLGYLYPPAPPKAANGDARHA